MVGIYEDEILGAQQQRDLARKLRDTEVPSTGHMIGDWYVAPTVAQQLSAVLKQGIGAYKEHQAEDEIKGLKQERARSSADAFSQMGMQAPSGLLAEAGTPAQKPSIMDRIGAVLTFNAQPKGTPAQPYQQTIAQNPNETQTMGGILNLAGSNPEMAAVAQAMQGQKWTRENAAAVAKQARQDKIDDAIRHEGFVSGENELNRENQKIGWAMTAANRQAPQAPSWQIHTNADGSVVQVHPQTGEIRPLQGLKGKDTSNLPMTPTREKMISEADESVEANTRALENLENAKKLSVDTFNGLGAYPLAVVQSNNPFADKTERQTADNTIVYDNLIKGGILESLKTTFGKAPSDYEGKMLISLGASSDKTAAQKLVILNDAIAHARSKLAAHTKKAEGLRSGSYFAPDEFAGFTEADKAEFEKEHGVAK